MAPALGLLGLSPVFDALSLLTLQRNLHQNSAVARRLRLITLPSGQCGHGVVPLGLVGPLRPLARLHHACPSDRGKVAR